jgi:hypothetical protein
LGCDEKQKNVINEENAQKVREHSVLLRIPVRSIASPAFYVDHHATLGNTDNAVPVGAVGGDSLKCVAFIRFTRDIVNDHRCDAATRQASFNKTK